MKKLIIFIMMLIVLCSFSTANNETGTQYIWEDEFDSITSWTTTDSWTVTNFQGENRLQDTDAGSSQIYLDSQLTPKDTGFCLSFIFYDSNIVYNYDIISTNGNFGVSAQSYYSAFKVNFAGDDIDINTDGAGWTFGDYDFSSSTWYKITSCFKSSYSEIYVNDTIILNVSNTANTLSNYVDIGLRGDSVNTLYFDKYKVWFGVKSDEPTGYIPPPIFSTSLLYPTNESTSSSYLGWINISLSNVNGSATCTLNNSDWTFSSNDNSTYSFYRAVTPAHQNYSIDYYCQDSGGNWSNSSFWFNIENLLTIDIYDEQTNKKINESISFIFRSGDYEYHDISTNGTYILYNESGLPPDTYQVTLNGTNYYQRIYHLTVTEVQVQHNNFYLLKTNSSSLVTFYVRNLADISLENISIVFTTWINLTHSDAPITHRFTDNAGSMLVNLHYLTRYGITLTDPTGKYSPRYTEIEPVFPSYILLLDLNASKNFTTVWDHISYIVEQTNYSLNPTETNFSFTTTSDNGNIESYGLYATINGTYYITNITTHASGGTTYLTLPLNESDNENIKVNYFISSLDPYALIVPLTYSILNITSWQGNNSVAVILPEYREEFSERFRLLTAIFCSIIVIAVFSQFIRKNYAPLVGIPVLIVFAIPPISWIPPWIVIFMSIIIGGFFVAFGDW